MYTKYNSDFLKLVWCFRVSVERRVLLRVTLSCSSKPVVVSNGAARWESTYSSLMRHRLPHIYIWDVWTSTWWRIVVTVLVDAHIILTLHVYLPMLTAPAWVGSGEVITKASLNPTFLRRGCVKPRPFGSVERPLTTAPGLSFREKLIDLCNNMHV